MADEERLLVSLEARIRDFERNFQRANQTASKNFGAIENRSKQATKRLEKQMANMASKVGGIGKSMAAGLVGGLVAGGINGMVDRVGNIAKGIAEIGNEAKRAGMKLEDFQEWKYVAEQNRIGVDSLTDGIKELNLRADEFIVTGGGSAAEAFQRLGFSADALKAKLKDPSALFTEIIGKLGQLDRAAQIRIADELFGGTGGERFVELIDQGADGLNRTRQEARDLGLVMSQDVIEKAAELDRKFNQVANTVDVALKQAIVEAAAALGDFLNAFSQLPGMVSLRERTAPLNERSIDIMREQLASKKAALESDTGWFGIGSMSDEAKDKLRAEIAELEDAIVKRFDPRQFDIGETFNRAAKTPSFESVDDMRTPVVAPIAPASGSKSGGASGMREQRDAAASLIAELQEELRLMGQSELEQRVNAELRRAGAGATDAQKASITELITAIESEKAAMQRLEEASSTAKGIAKDFLGGLISDLRNGVDGATALANAFGRLADRLIDMALDSLINSLFSNLGGVAGGGLFGGLFGFKDGGAVEAATGGLIRGPGTATSDSIPARLSDGEFVVNASATRANLDLLRAINDGTVRGFADGGLAAHAPSLAAANDNYRFANDNAAPVTINAPITVNGSAGTPEQNQDLAKRMATQLEGTMRGLVADELRRQKRPGNALNTRNY